MVDNVGGLRANMGVSITFQCLRCMRCCNSERFGSEILFIPIYLDELKRIKHLAEQRKLKIQLKPDITYYDELNNRLIIVTYALYIDKNGCPFYKLGCSIYDERPITCRAYPLSILRTEDTTTIILKPECTFVEKNRRTLADLDYYSLGDVFSDEFRYAREIQIKGNTIVNQIEKLESEGKIRILVKLPVELTEETLKLEKIQLDEI
ncbi:MAG: YkgJ family cysteine cluster protein [Candidatus Helarchaeota archaeon]